MREDRKTRKSADAVGEKRMTERKLKLALKVEYGKHPPGTPLPPRSKLREMLSGNDRTMKRAVEALTDEGFFMQGANNRLVVSGMGLLKDHNPSTIETFLEFRLLIEPVVAGVAAQAFKQKCDGANTREKLAFENALHDLPDPKYEKGVAVYRKADRAFHRALHALSTNSMLAMVLKQIDHAFDENIDGVVSRLYGVGTYRADTYRQHMKMAEAILAGREGDAVTATREHLSYAHQAILRYIRDMPA